MTTNSKEVITDMKDKIRNLIADKAQMTTPPRSTTAVKNRLKVLRAERDWTQADLAERVGISRQAVISIEKYKYAPSLELAFKLAKAFGVELMDVFRLEEEGEKNV